MIRVILSVFAALLGHMSLMSILMCRRGEVGDPVTPVAPVTPEAPAAITSEGINGLEGDSFRAVVPSEFAEKGYLKDVNSFGDVFKKLDGAQTLLGQRTTPALDAPEDAWQKFHAPTRPETAELYTMPEIEGVPAEFIAKAEKSQTLRKIMHDASASPYQAKALLTGFLKEFYTAEQSMNSEKETKFAELSTEVFGDKKDDILKNGKNFLAANIPENIAPLLEGLDANAMTVLLAATDTMAKKFTGEDPYRGGADGTAPTSGEGKDALVNRMKEIMGDPAYNDAFKDRAKNSQLNQEMETIREKLKKIMG